MTAEFLAIPRSSPVSAEALGRIHAAAITDSDQIRALFNRLRLERCSLQGRRTLRGDAEEARVREIEGDEVVLRASHLTQKAQEQVVFNFELDGQAYFFSTAVRSALDEARPRIALPAVVYIAERRDRARRTLDPSSRQTVQLAGSNWRTSGVVADLCAVGLSVLVPDHTAIDLGDPIRVQYESGDLAGQSRWAQVRHFGASPENGWIRVGLSVSDTPHSPPLEVERRGTLASGSRRQRFLSTIGALSAGAFSASARVLPFRSRMLAESAIEIVDYSNERGERIRGIVDRANHRPGGLGILIPPAWGRTKETLLPLALTIVETFRQAGESVTVLRFDGTRRRGESFKEPAFAEPGREHLGFTFSHAIDDIRASTRFLIEDERTRCSRVLLVTFSAASIEGRRAVMLDGGENIAGWVSVVGTPDLQSGLRTVSGGIDYVGAAERGVFFGIQEIMGVVANVGLMMEEAIAARLPFLEDARRDMAAITVPITWIHGANDGWLDIERVREIMGCGETATRKLIEVPTGHQLRSSLEALEVFRLVSQEAFHLALGRACPGALPSLLEVEARRKAERKRLPRGDLSVRQFWRDYLVGREGHLGIELMNASSAYQALMDTQIEGLQIRDGVRIADVGAGAGSFPIAVMRRENTPQDVVIDEIDYVQEALDRARERISRLKQKDIIVNFVRGDLEEEVARRSLLGNQRYDAALVSLVIGYVRDPLGLLIDIRSALRPKGRLVISVMRRDADVSRLFIDALDELRAGRAREFFGNEGERILDESARLFLNDAARILDLEEAGVFRFFDADELSQLVRQAGFRELERRSSFGDPAQAVVLVAERDGALKD